MDTPPQQNARAISVILAAGRGTRMKGYQGNKTLLPLAPTDSPFRGERPLLVQVLESVPPGPKVVVVHHRKEEVMAACGDRAVRFAEQPETNGTGGALLAAAPFLHDVDETYVIVTMGDVPLVRRETYLSLLRQATRHAFVVLGFTPADPARYGVLETEEDRVIRITEWTYWKEYPEKKRRRMRYYNAGVYAGRRPELLEAARELARRPHEVRKERNGRLTTIREYFLTDLVEILAKQGHSVGYVVCEDESEVMGVDTPEALERVQRAYAMRHPSAPEEREGAG